MKPLAVAVDMRASEIKRISKMCVGGLLSGAWGLSALATLKLFVSKAELSNIILFDVKWHIFYSFVIVFTGAIFYKKKIDLEGTRLLSLIILFATFALYFIFKDGVFIVSGLWLLISPYSEFVEEKAVRDKKHGFILCNLSMIFGVVISIIVGFRAFGIIHNGAYSYYLYTLIGALTFELIAKRLLWGYSIKEFYSYSKFSLKREAKGLFDKYKNNSGDLAAYVVPEIVFTYVVGADFSNIYWFAFFIKTKELLHSINSTVMGEDKQRFVQNIKHKRRETLLIGFIGGVLAVTISVLVVLNLQMPISLLPAALFWLIVSEFLPLAVQAKKVILVQNRPFVLLASSIVDVLTIVLFSILVPNVQGYMLGRTTAIIIRLAINAIGVKSIKKHHLALSRAKVN